MQLQVSFIIALPSTVSEIVIINFALGWWCDLIYNKYLVDVIAYAHLLPPLLSCFIVQMP